MFILLIIVMYSEIDTSDDKSTTYGTYATSISKDSTYHPEDSSKSSKYVYVCACVPEGISNNAVVIPQYEYNLRQS